VRAVVLTFVALAIAGCDETERRAPGAASLQKLEHLTEEQNHFGVVVDGKSGKARAAFRVDNPIRAAVPDGEGGWYIGGGFLRVDGQLRKRLAHVRGDGTLDPDWRPEANGNRVSVTALARIASRLYVGGDFARLNHRERLHLGAVDARDGRLLPWRPDSDAPSWYPVLLATRDRLFVGGYSGTPGTSGLTALDPVSGRRDPAWRGIVDTANLEGGGVRLIVPNRGRLYFAGMFSTVDGVSTPGVAAVDIHTGAIARRWRPPLQSRFCLACTEVTALAAGPRVVYVALPRAIRALDAETGTLVRRWKPRLSLTTGIYIGASVSAMERVGKRLYVAGAFDTVHGTRSPAVAALDVATARPLPSWMPKANATGSLVVPSGSHVLVAVDVMRGVQFDVAGLEAAKQPVRRLDLVLALSAAGSVRIGLGSKCNRERWAETGRCFRRVSRWLASVRFPRAMRKHWRRELAVPPGRYFVRFVPRSEGGAPQPPYDIDFRHG
jgi:PQQ-like domain